MKKRFIFIKLLLVCCFTTAHPQAKLGIETGASLNFQTVNSIIRNSITQQTEYIGTGQTYNMGLCYSFGSVVGVEISDKIEANLHLKYMLKKVRVNFQSRTNSNENFYLFDLNYHYFKIPITLKILKHKHFFYDVSLVNNFLVSYEKNKLRQTLYYQNIKNINRYNIGIAAGVGFVVFKDFDLFIHGETDITPFLSTSDYGGDNHYPFRFHNFTIGLRYWLIKRS